MAPDMLLLKPDEVARNGAFGKQLRPEVFPNAPLQFSHSSTKGHSARFPGNPPPRVLVEVLRIKAGKSGGVSFGPSPPLCGFRIPRRNSVRVADSLANGRQARAN